MDFRVWMSHSMLMMMWCLLRLLMEPRSNLVCSDSLGFEACERKQPTYAWHGLTSVERCSTMIFVTWKPLRDLCKILQGCTKNWTIGDYNSTDTARKCAAIFLSVTLPNVGSFVSRFRSGDCLEGMRENYQVCSVQYCAQQLCTVQCTHIWTDLTVLWIRFCLTGPISLCLDSFLYVYYCMHV